jgi:hypothetical protein
VCSPTAELGVDKGRVEERSGQPSAGGPSFEVSVAHSSYP